MVQDIPHEASLILNFFGGKVYFTFENEDEVDSLFRLLSIHDSRAELIATQKSRIKSAAWIYSNLLHKHQIEWMDDETHFRKYDMYPISYSVVKDYVDDYENTIRKFLSFSDDVESGIPWAILLLLFCFAGTDFNMFSSPETEGEKSETELI